MPNATHVGFIPEPNSGRGTIGLLWQCLTVIFLCTFTVLHLNVPIRPIPLRTATRMYATWVGLVLFMPELLFFQSYFERTNARQFRRKWNQLADYSITMKQAFFFLSGGFDVILEGADERHDQHLDPVALLKYIRKSRTSRQHRIADILDVIAEELPSDPDIDALSKADRLSKAITCLQSLWLLIQIIGRLSQHLGVSLLEVVAAAFILNAIVAYALWYQKPYNISHATRCWLSAAHFQGLPKGMMIHVLPEKLKLVEEDRLMLDPIGNWRLWVSTFGIAALATGGIHGAAWLYEFPTLTEAWLWRACAIIIGAVAFIGSGIAPTDREPSVWMWVPIYAVARLYILVEVFVSLRSVPVSVYDSLQWPSYIGHIGP